MIGAEVEPTCPIPSLVQSLCQPIGRWVRHLTSDFEGRCDVILVFRGILSSPVVHDLR